MIPGSPTVRRRRLSAELVRMREQAGMTVEEVTKSLEWSRGRLSHMEQNRWTRPDLGNIRALLNLYGVTDPEVCEAILNLARQSREKGWWAQYKDIFGGSLPGFEAEATQIRSFELALVPGLLQTPDYAKAIFHAGQVLDEAAVQRRVEARCARQGILDRQAPPQFWAVIDEAALRKSVGGEDVMARQLEHLVLMAKRPNITIQILPDSVGAHAALQGAFVILDFSSALDPSLVYLETATESLWLEKVEQVQAYTLIYNRIVAAAMTAEESLRHMTTLSDRPLLRS
ncbi:helix-turn-helix domain-containing protein [Sphaerisporangium rhizosphaerae]|uniref:Helix-turn-helix domain-containing protein n=1 Tax=Sphaerisporangium rhizosphaerae TaxID=2269375 RepID=A0ABW2NYB9_9ACTN